MEVAFDRDRELTAPDVLREAGERILESGPASLTGPGLTRWVANAGHWNGTMTAHRLPVEGLGSLMPGAKGWPGRAGGTLELTGRPGASRSAHIGSW